ncbi:MAG: AAA family ATPase, partial [Gudongella sp.]|nr:AAA family ATPase [Gudongella sp.]
MLKELHISNFAIIDDLTIEFEKGFNLLTGETGSGKSIIIEALELVLGGRGSRDMIRSGEEKAIVEAMFAVDDRMREIMKEQDVDEDDWLILTRELSDKYPSVSRVNGRPVTLSVLNSLTKGMVDVFGQHEHQSLLDISNHIKIVDSMIPQRGKELIGQLEDDYNTYRELIKSRDGLMMSAQERERETDLLTFQIKEIDEARLTEDDDEKLEAEFKRLFNLKDIIGGVSQAADLLGSSEYGAEGAISQIEKSVVALRDIKKFDKDLEEKSDRLDSLKYELEDLARELSGYVESQEIDEEALFSLRERLDKVNSLKKKYGNTVENILVFRDEAESRLTKLQNLDAELEGIEGKIESLKSERRKKAQTLSLFRKEAAEVLDKKMEQELSALSMENVTFKTGFKEREETGRNGLDEIEILIATNP